MDVMSITEIFVLLGAAVAIAWVNWYFVFSRGTAVEAGFGSGGVQEVVIRVAGGYEPSSVRVRRGRPVRLVFERREESGCSEELVLPDFGVRRYLPAHERTVVELTPAETGDFDFTCGMGMLRGRLIVEDGEDRA